MTSMAGSLVGPRTGNTAVHGDRVRVVLSDPPREADGVVIRILQFETPVSPAQGPYELVAFHGVIRAHKFRLSHAIGVPAKDTTPLKRKEIQITFVPPDVTKSSDEFTTRIRDPAKLVTQHRIDLRIRGRTGTLRRFYIGNTALTVFHKQAMIVPQGFAPVLVQGTKHDPAMRIIPDWASQWAGAAPLVRKSIPLRTITPAIGPLNAHSYDEVLGALEKAAVFAKHGIVALAVGHGDGGTSNPSQDAWCDLAAEDGKIDDYNYIRGLFVDQKELEEGKGKHEGTTVVHPDARTYTKMKAMNEMARIFEAHPIRLMLLHTCKAGGNKPFIQMFCDRVQVHVRAHTETILYDDAPRGSIRAAYAGETFDPPDEDEPPETEVQRLAREERAKQALTEWPTRRLAEERIPGDVPETVEPL